MNKKSFISPDSIYGWRLVLIVCVGFFASFSYLKAEEHQNKSMTTVNPDSMVVEFYPIPSPDEILEYIDRNSLHYRESLLNNLQNVELYNTSFEKKIGFGIYLSDLAYALSFDQTGSVINYFGTIEDMGRELNLFPSEVSEISERFINNVNQHDSLKNLYTDSYILMIDHLDQTSNVGSYAIISAGSFVESIYIALNSVKTDADDDAYRLRIWNQKLVFQQLVKIAERNLEKSQKERLLSDMAGLKRVFDSYVERPKPPKSQVKGNGTVVLGQQPSNQPDTSTEMPASVGELRKEIDLLRRKWVKR
jgi:hypothetical protein